MVKVVMGALPSCLACKAHQPSTTQPGMAMRMLDHQPGGSQSPLKAQAPLTLFPGTCGELVLMVCVCEVSASCLSCASLCFSSSKHLQHTWTAFSP